MPCRIAISPVCEPVDYFCAPLSIDDYAATICEPLEARRPELKLLLEPGRFVAGNTALLVTTIENRRPRGGATRRGGASATSAG